jgi:hypothetical protein
LIRQAEAFAENLPEVWLQRLGAGVPIVSLVVLAYAYRTLARDGSTT